MVSSLNGSGPVVRSYADLEALNQNAANGYLGLQVSYDLEGVQVEKTLLTSLLAASPFNAFKAPDISPLVRAQRSIREMIRDEAHARGGTRLSRGAMSSADDADGDGRSDVFGLETMNPKGGEWHIILIVRKTADWVDLGLDVYTDARFFVHKKTGTVFVTRSQQGQQTPGSEDTVLARKLDPYWLKWGVTASARDVSVLVRQIIDWLKAFPVRRDGGVYMIPTKRYDVDGNLLPDTITPQVYALRQLILNLPYSGRRAPSFRVMRIVDAEAEQEEAAGAAYDELMDELGRLETDMDKMEADNTSYSSTVGSRLVEYQEIKQRAGIYAQALGLQTRQIDAKIQLLEQKALSVLTSISTRPKKTRQKKGA